MDIPTASILVCKVLLSKSTADVESSYFDAELSPSEVWARQPIDPNDLKEYRDQQSVYRSTHHDPKTRLWFVLDNALILPEYLVEFEYQRGANTGTPGEQIERAVELFEATNKAQALLQNTHINP